LQKSYCPGGWLLDELQRDYRSRVALWVDAACMLYWHFYRAAAEILAPARLSSRLIAAGLTFVWGVAF